MRCWQVGARMTTALLSLRRAAPAAAMKRSSSLGRIALLVTRRVLEYRHDGRPRYVVRLSTLPGAAAAPWTRRSEPRARRPRRRRRRGGARVLQHARVDPPARANSFPSERGSTQRTATAPSRRECRCCSPEPPCRGWLAITAVCRNADVTPAHLGLPSGIFHDSRAVLRPRMRRSWRTRPVPSLGGRGDCLYARVDARPTGSIENIAAPRERPRSRIVTPPDGLHSLVRAPGTCANLPGCDDTHCWGFGCSLPATTTPPRPR